MKALLLAFLSAVIVAASGCSPKTTTTPATPHTQLTATAGGHYITADVEGEAGVHNYITQAVITSSLCSLLICQSGVYFGTNQIAEQQWTAIPDGVPIDLHITHDKFSVQWGTNQLIKTPNKSPEPTAVGAGRSAVAVHVAGRRWLSFLR
jgi:hypothetical protein